MLRLFPAVGVPDKGNTVGISDASKYNDVIAFDVRLSSKEPSCIF